MEGRLTFKRAASRIRDERGQAAIEMMLVVPLFILLILLCVDMGIWAYQSVSAANAVREGARWGAVNCGMGECTADDVAERAEDRSPAFLSMDDFEVGWLDRDDDGTNPGNKGDSVIVKIIADRAYNLLFFPGAKLPLSSCADMRLEQTDGNSPLPAPPSGSGC